MITPIEFERAETLRQDMARRLVLCHEDGNTPAAFCVSVEDVGVLSRAACLEVGQDEGEEMLLFMGIKVLPFEVGTYCKLNIKGGAYVIREEARLQFEPIVRAGGFTGAVVGIYPGELRLIADAALGPRLDGGD